MLSEKTLHAALLVILRYMRIICYLHRVLDSWLVLKCCRGERCLVTGTRDRVYLDKSRCYIDAGLFCAPEQAIVLCTMKMPKTQTPVCQHWTGAFPETSVLLHGHPGQLALHRHVIPYSGVAPKQFPPPSCAGESGALRSDACVQNSLGETPTSGKESR